MTCTQTFPVPGDDGAQEWAIAEALEAHMHKQPERKLESRTMTEPPGNGWAMFVTLLLLLPATAFAISGTFWIAAWLYALSVWPCAGLDFARR